MATVAYGPELTAEKTEVKNKVCLIQFLYLIDNSYVYSVHDGWGIAPELGIDGNAVEAAKTHWMDTIAKDHSYRTLRASGLAVGLNDGLMGNSEVGHLNVGAGRVVWQDIVRIDVSIKKKEFHKNPVILEACQRAKSGNGRLHLLGLISDGGVHSHITHLFALLETAKAQGVPHTYVHFFGDGRDTAPRSATTYLASLQRFTEELGYGELATIVGRYYAMDRDKRWERVAVAVRGLTRTEAGDFETVSKATVEVKAQGEEAISLVESNYAKDITDEFLKPIIVNGDKGKIGDGDTLFFFNYRSDRMREVVSVFGGLEGGAGEVPKDLAIYTMSQYKKEFPFKAAFPPQAMTNVLAEWLAKKGVKQAHVAETEKYAHVTFFFNGGVEKQWEGEDRYMIPSPKVATYDLEPKMSVHKVAQKVSDLLDKGDYEFVMCNFAPPDMVGHTGVYSAAVEAISETDEAVGTIYNAAQKNGYVLLVTADHGNAEQMKDPKTGNPHTAHTTNPVPFIMAGNSKGKKGEAKTLSFVDEPKATKPSPGAEEEEGALADVAPTILEVMGLDKPEEMTGRSLLAKD